MYSAYYIILFVYTCTYIYIYLEIWEPVWSYLSIYGTDSADTSVSVNLSIFWNLWLKPHTRFLYDTAEIGIGLRFGRYSHRDHRENLWHRVHRGLLWHIESSHGLVQQKIDNMYIDYVYNMNLLIYIYIYTYTSVWVSIYLCINSKRVFSHIFFLRCMERFFSKPARGFFSPSHP